MNQKSESEKSLEIVIEKQKREINVLKEKIKDIQNISDKSGYFIASESIGMEQKIESFIESIYPMQNDKNKWSKID